MLPRCAPAARGNPLFRPLRPPNPASTVPRPRLFTQKHPLLIINRTSRPRPQLPYLSQPSHLPHSLPRGPTFQRQLARLLTTETRRYVREQFWLATKWTAIGWVMLWLLAYAQYGWLMELIEREHPSPPEWRYWTRRDFRTGWLFTDPEVDKLGIINWPRVANEFRRCVWALEDTEKDGQGLVRLPLEDDDGEEVAGVRRASWDTTVKSEAWRAGYFESVMGCARAAEHLDGMVRDKTRGLVFPKEFMIGPSNPNARPAHPNMHDAPLEENCDTPFPPPEWWYSRILKSKGFTTRQRLDAALAHANWLEYKGLEGSAEELYRQGVEIAASALPNPDEVVDTTTGVIKEQAIGRASPNLLRATTAFATYQARTANVSNALPVFLSVLRARRHAPIDQSAVRPAPKRQETASTDIDAVFRFFKGIIRSSAYPLPLTSGDEPAVRSSATETDCADAELMMYVGEILFATSSSKPDEGISWTKQAVEISERRVREQGLDKTEMNKCKACLETSMGNWSTMARRLAKQEQELKTREGDASQGWKGWFGGSKTPEKVESSHWKEEAERVEARRMVLVREGITEKLIANQGVPGSVWLG